MAISDNLISKFVKTTSPKNKKTKKETFLRGNIKYIDGQYKIMVVDMSQKIEETNYTPQEIPLDKIPNGISVDQPVTVMIKNHTVTVIGNAADVDEEKSTEETLNNTTSTIRSIATADILALWNK